MPGCEHDDCPDPATVTINEDHVRTRHFCEPHAEQYIAVSI